MRCRSLHRVSSFFSSPTIMRQFPVSRALHGLNFHFCCGVASEPCRDTASQGSLSLFYHYVLKNFQIYILYRLVNLLNYLKYNYIGHKDKVFFICYTLTFIRPRYDSEHGNTTGIDISLSSISTISNFWRCLAICFSGCQSTFSGVVTMPK